ncbi:MAG: hypothetical protein O4859_05180 [Trichodesmium sp. St18_bin1]|nr:hypothetical protein [Trichodesmium sp. St18_bin1]MDE5121996.1 hypothetical protein [Trichodesmium sp. St19_bin1]
MSTVLPSHCYERYLLVLLGIAGLDVSAIRVISRRELTSQTCCHCRFKGGKLDLSIREWECSTLWG